MIINQKQTDQLKKHAWENFTKRAIEHLRQEMGSYTTGLSDQELRDRIDFTVNLANIYGLTAEQDVICLLDAGLLLNDRDFPENPRYAIIRSVLTDKDLTPEERARHALVLALQLN